MSSQHGFGIVMAIFILVVLGLLGGFMVRISSVAYKSADDIFQGIRAYQAANAGMEWAVSRIGSYGGGCADVNAQTAMSFDGLNGFSVKLTCTSQTESEGLQNLIIYKIHAISEFGAYSSPDYVARELEQSFVMN